MLRFGAICSHFFSFVWMSSTPRPHYRTELFCKKMPVLDQKVASEVRNFFDSQKEEKYFEEQVTRQKPRRGLKKDFTKHQTVSFDQDCNVIAETVTDPFQNFKDVESLKKATAAGLKAMAKTLGWAGQTHMMAISLMQHQLEEGESSSGIEFHKDDSDYAMVVLLEDSKDPKTGWQGGDLLFRPHESRILEGCLQPECGYGILFSNRGTQHAVTPFKPRDISQRLIKRTILTFHDYEQPNEKPLEKKDLKSSWHYLKVCAENIFSRISTLTTHIFSFKNP